MKGKYILIADDEKKIRHFLSETLNDYGFRSKVVSEGQKALEKIEEGKDSIFLLILDVNIKNENEVPILEIMKEKGININTLFLCADVMAVERTKRKFPKGLFLKKPFTPKQLRTKIRAFMNIIS